MFNAEEFEQWINQKQHGRKIEEDLQPLSPDAYETANAFGCVSPTDIRTIDSFKEKREICFLSSEKLRVRRLGDEAKFASLEEALPGGREQWKFISYLICPEKMALILRFLPVSEEMMREAIDIDAKCQELDNSTGVDEEPADPSLYEYGEPDWVELSESDSLEGHLIDKYSLQLELTGAFKVVFEGDGDGEYVRRGKAHNRHSTGSTSKVRIQYIEFANDLKTCEHILTEGEKTMRSTYYN